MMLYLILQTFLVSYAVAFCLFILIEPTFELFHRFKPWAHAHYLEVMYSLNGPRLIMLKIIRVLNWLFVVAWLILLVPLVDLYTFHRITTESPDGMTSWWGTFTAHQENLYFFAQVLTALSIGWFMVPENFLRQWQKAGIFVYYKQNWKKRPPMNIYGQRRKH